MCIIFIYSVNVITSSNNFAGSLTFKLTNIPYGNKNLPIVWRFSLNLAGKFINNLIDKTMINLKKTFRAQLKHTVVWIFRRSTRSLDYAGIIQMSDDAFETNTNW